MDARLLFFTPVFLFLSLPDLLHEQNKSPNFMYLLLDFMYLLLGGGLTPAQNLVICMTEVINAHDSGQFFSGPSLIFLSKEFISQSQIAAIL